MQQFILKFNQIQAIQYIKKDHIKAVRIVKTKFGGNKGIAYVDFDSMQEANNACLMMNDTTLEGERLVVALSAPPKKQTCSQNSTAYLSNLPFNIQESEIKQAFPDFEINQIRMIRNSKGEFRGFCYVEFNDENNLIKAIELFNQNPFIQKRKIQCEKSEGSAKDRLKAIKGQIQHDDHKPKQNPKNEQNFTVFLKNISFKTLESDVREFFKDQNVDEVLIAKDKETNKPKGFAFVSFKDRTSYQEAISMGQGFIRKREFEIQKYDKTGSVLKSKFH